jgi:hypothetical protein
MAEKKAWINRYRAERRNAWRAWKKDQRRSLREDPRTVQTLPESGKRNRQFSWAQFERGWA